MFIDIQDYIEYLIKYKITPNQFLFLYLRHTLDTDSMDQYIKNVRAWKREEIQDLVNRGFVDDVNSPGEEYAHFYFVMPKFSYEMWIDFQEAGEELWEAFPHFISINGQKKPSRNCDKEYLFNIYGIKIKRNRRKHARILEIVKYLKSFDKINFTIEDFVLKEFWKPYWTEEDRMKDLVDQAEEI